MFLQINHGPAREWPTDINLPDLQIERPPLDVANQSIIALIPSLQRPAHHLLRAHSQGLRLLGSIRNKRIKSPVLSLARRPQA